MNGSTPKEEETDCVAEASTSNTPPPAKNRLQTFAAAWRSKGEEHQKPSDGGGPDSNEQPTNKPLQQQQPVGGGGGLFSRFRARPSAVETEGSSEQKSPTIDNGGESQPNSEPAQPGMFSRLRAAGEEYARKRREEAERRAQEEAKARAEEKAARRAEEKERARAMKESMKQMGILGDDDDDDSDDDESSSEGDDHLSIPSDVSLTNSEISDLKKHDFTKIDITVMKNLHAELQEKGMPAVLTCREHEHHNNVRRLSVISLGDESYVRDMMNQTANHERDVREEALEEALHLYKIALKRKKIKEDEKLFEMIFQEVVREIMDREKVNVKKRDKIIAGNPEIVERILRKRAAAKGEGIGAKISSLWNAWKKS